MSKPLTYLSLFSGIGGLDLGLEEAGMECVGQVEMDPFCQLVLATHWPEVPRHDDVRTTATWWLGATRPRVDVVAGGVPCQPFSRAGRKRGVGDERWGWPWMFDVIRAVRPRYVLVENVAALLDDADAFGWVLGDLAAYGLDAEWEVLSACALGAPHPRERLFLVAYPHGIDGPPRLGSRPAQRVAGSTGRAPAGVVGRAEARTWRHRVDESVEASRSDDREADGAAGQMVSALGNAVVPQVGAYIGRLIVGHASGELVNTSA